MRNFVFAAALAVVGAAGLADRASAQVFYGYSGVGVYPAGGYLYSSSYYPAVGVYPAGGYLYSSSYYPSYGGVSYYPYPGWIRGAGAMNAAYYGGYPRAYYGGYRGWGGYGYRGYRRW